MDRRLRSVRDEKLAPTVWNLATDACSIKEEFESCMEDVMATGDVDLALAW